MTTDEQLRDAKPPFIISDRPNQGPTLWVRGQKRYTQKQALAIARGEEKARDKLRGGLQTSTVSGS